MMESESLERPAAVAAALVASCLMLVLGVAYRVVAARLEVPTDATPISPDALAQFPMQIGDWTGEDVASDEAIVRQTGTDAHLDRRYSRRGDLEAVYFYIASGIKARDLMPHRPEVCYTGAGWTLANRKAVELPLSDSAKLPCNVIQFSRGALNTQEVVVLDYYLVDGQFCADVSLLRSKAWRGQGSVRYVAQIEIIAPVTEALKAEAAARLVQDFAVESAAWTASLFDGSKTNQRESRLHEPPKGQ
jgi:EpsI family protein